MVNILVEIERFVSLFKNYTVFFQQYANFFLSKFEM